jgi:hypothetical protein
MVVGRKHMYSIRRILVPLAMYSTKYTKERL